MTKYLFAESQVGNSWQKSWLMAKCLFAVSRIDPHGK
jgi:hypothetical protein